MKAGFENIDCIKFTNLRKVRAWLLWKKTIVDFEITTKPDGSTFQYRSLSGKVHRPKDKKGTTDFCSTPPFLWWIKWFAPCRFSYSGTMHDQAYLHHAIIIDGLYTVIMRVYADDLFHEMIENEPDPGTPREAWTYEEGVRLFGWMAWGKGDEPVEPVGKIDVNKFPIAFA